MVLLLSLVALLREQGVICWICHQVELTVNDLALGLWSSSAFKWASSSPGCDSYRCFFLVHIYRAHGNLEVTN